MSEKKKVVAKKYPQTVYVTMYNDEIDTAYTKNDLADSDLSDLMEVGEYVFKQSGKVKSSVSIELA